MLSKPAARYLWPLYVLVQHADARNSLLTMPDLQAEDGCRANTCANVASWPRLNFKAAAFLVQAIFDRTNTVVACSIPVAAHDTRVHKLTVANEQQQQHLAAAHCHGDTHRSR